MSGLKKILEKGLFSAGFVLLRKSTYLSCTFELNSIMKNMLSQHKDIIYVRFKKIV